MSGLPQQLKESISELQTAMGRALLSALVGAGYSFNSIKKDDSAQYISWERLGELVTAALFTLRGEPVPKWDSDAFDPNSLLETAQDYKELAIAKGAKSLDDLIYESTSDEKLAPGPLHIKLLSLNWSDIYTTNYDLLFERTLAEDKGSDKPVIHTKHNIIVRENQLPLGKPSGSRRLVKLHGSFPDVKPFVLAQGDYNAYPDQHELFVQAVQHALVTETFCLIGFSGTDPNFRKWVEWVSEKLRGDQPKMYLIDFQAPKPDDIPYYEQNNIIHVNIAPLAGLSQCDSNAERQSALDIFLDRLKIEYPEEPLWSYDSGDFQKSDPLGYSSLDQYVEAASALRAKRETYPGWVFPPLEVIRKAEFCFMYRYLPNFPRLLLSGEYASDRLVQWLVAYEYLWAYDTFCIPPDALESKGIEALAGLIDDVWPLQYETDLEARLEKLPEVIVVDRESFIRSLQDAACMFIRLWRRYGVEGGVAAWQAELAKSLAASPNADAENWSRYNAILWCLENCDPTGADTLLDSWLPEGSDLYWKTRKANLLAERERTKESRQLLKSSLVDIRDRIHQEGKSAYLLSCEAWTERFLEVVQQSIASNEPIDSIPVKNPSRDYDMLSRTPVLRRLAFHPFQILKGLEERFDTIANSQPMGEPELDYCSGDDTRKNTFDSGFQKGVHDAHIFYGMLERTALPPRIDDTSTGGGRLSNKMWMNGATVLLRVYRYHHAFIFPLVHRMLEPGVFANNQVLFSRYAMANLAQDRACHAFDMAMKLLTQLHDESKADTKLRIRYNRYMQFLLEYVGRLCPLVDAPRIERLLDEVYGWHLRNDFFFHLKTAAVFLGTFSQAVRSAPPALLEKHLFALMTLPIVPEILKNATWIEHFRPLCWPAVLEGRNLAFDGMDWDAVAIKILEDLASQERWLSSLPPSQGPGRANAVPEELAKLVDDYIESARPEQERLQRNNVLFPYWSVLVLLKDQNLLTDKSISLITEHLWNGYHGLAPALPGQPSIAVCWYFPFPDQQQCIAAFKERLFAEAMAPGGHDPLFWCEALGCCLEFAGRYPLSSEELEMLLAGLRRSSIPGPGTASPFGRHDDPSLASTMRLLQAWGGRGLAFSCNGDRGCVESLREWLDQLRDHALEYGYQTEALDVLRLEFDPETATELAEKYRAQLFTGPRRTEAGNAAVYWEYVFSDVVPLPERYSGMVAECFQIMRSPESMELLGVLRSQVEGYGRLFSEKEIPAVIRGLEILLEELRYEIPNTEEFPSSHPPLKPFPLHIPYYRETVALFLKGILARDASFGNNAVIQRWIESIRQDPLADIRNILP